MRKMLTSIMFIMIMFLMVFISGCMNNKEMESIELNRNTIKEVYYINEFSIDGIEIIIDYKDGSHDIIELKEEYMNKKVENFKSEVGQHNIEINYNNCKTILTINIENKVYKINYYVNNELIQEEEYIENESINDLYDYETKEDDTIWYYDKSLTQKVVLPLIIKEEISLYTNNKPIEYTENNIIYREKQDNTYMVYKSLTSRNDCLFIPEEVNGKKVTSISENIFIQSKENGLFDSVFLPSTITNLQSKQRRENDTVGDGFAIGTYFIGELKGLIIETYGKNELLCTRGVCTGAFKVEKYIIENDVVYGLVNNELYLLDSLIEKIDEFRIPTEVQGYNATGIACYSGIANIANKVIIPSQIKNIDLFSFSGNTKNEKDTCEIIIEGKFNDFKEKFNYLFSGYYNFKIKFVNDVSTDFIEMSDIIKGHSEYFQYHYNVIDITFSDGKVFNYVNTQILYY